MPLKKKNTVYLICGILFIISFLFFPVASYSLGLEVNPGKIHLTGVPLGSQVDISGFTKEPASLQITNKGDMPSDYVISVLRTSETTAPLPAGYTDIPDTSWIIPQAREARVEAKQTKDVALYINIPDKRAYAGKKYQAIIEVKSKKNKPQNLFVLACQLQLTFKTKTQESGWLGRWFK